ncbi:unnamed protein product [Effrenium voratum]|uniref:Uncharacterized protein n=1 Tax=Effrenium voratum TaxID=2562239 RepID=A0AA36I1W5_9DINO|nr:unnamed protein product [Effrenium voratum]
MASDQSRLGPLALAVLTRLGLEISREGSIHVLRVSAGGRQPLVQRLARAQQRCPRFRVVDVGAAMNPWTLKVLNAVVDRTPQVVEDCFQQPWFSAAAARFCCRSGPHTWLQANNVTCFTKDFDFERCCRNGEPHQLLHFAMDVNKESAWDPLLHHVEVAGKFEFAVASHILEDIVNPEILLQMLPRIARRGFVAMPSKFTELKRGVDEGYGPHRGHIHHRWIGTIQSGQLLLLPKLAFLETIEGDIDVVGNALTADSIDMSFEWDEDDIPFSILNKGFVGPTPVHVIQMYLEVFRTADDVDDVYVHGSDEPESEIPCESRQEALPPSSPEPEAAIMSSVQFCSLRTFEGLSRDLAAQLGATGERCFHRELQEVRRRCLMAMKAVEAAMMIYHTCAAGEPPLGSAARSASFRRRRAS